LVPKLRKYSYPDRLKMIGITSLKERRVRGDMIEVYKLLTGKAHIEYEQFFTLAQSHYGLRGHEKKLAKDRSRLDNKETLLQPESGQCVEQPSSRSCECRIGEQF